MSQAIRPSKKAFLQILWTGVDSSVPSLFLFTDRKRYIFNCGEGLQRLFTQWKVKFGKIDMFFLTRYQWSHMGGFPGFGMTLRDIKSGVVANLEDEDDSNKKKKKKRKKNKIISENEDSEDTNEKTTVYAPHGLSKIISATHHFMRFDTTKVQLHLEEMKENSNTVYSDEEMKIHPITLTGSPSNTGSFCSSNKIIESINISPGVSPPVICYACHLNDIPGKFYNDQAVALGIPSGPQRQDLIDGKTITLENGLQITPEQVVGPREPGPIFLIIDCPSKSYVNSLIQNPSLQKYQTSSEKNVHLVIHLSTQVVCKTKSYIKWVNMFPDKTKHLYLNEVSKEKPCFKSQQNLQDMLNTLNKDLFPKLHEEKEDKVKPKNFDNNSTLPNFSKINLRDLINSRDTVVDLTETKNGEENEFLERLKKVLKSDRETVQTYNSPKLEMNETLNGSEIDNTELTESCSKLKRKLDHGNDREIMKKKYTPDSDNESESETEDEEDINFPEVVCLGTGASVPSKLRNVSSTLVFLNKQSAVLFDAGEGTYGQMYRHYGNELDNVLKKINFILISHMHADHHLGLIPLLKRLEELQKRPDDTVVVVGPKALLQWLSEYASVSEKLKFKFVDSHACRSPKELKFGFTIQAVPVNHPGYAHGFVVGHGDSKVTFSGDTMPCNSLVKAGRNSTFLIHEATIEDDMPEEAASRNHSTTSQALEIARKMKAKHVVLTHFSQRYPKMPSLNDVKLDQNTVVAFDHMKITPRDIPTFHEILPTLTNVFARETEED